MIEVLIIATMTVILQYKMYQIDILYVLNLHNVICQVYFDKNFLKELRTLAYSLK